MTIEGVEYLSRSDGRWAHITPNNQVKILTGRLPGVLTALAAAEEKVTELQLDLAMARVQVGFRDAYKEQNAKLIECVEWYSNRTAYMTGGFSVKEVEIRDDSPDVLKDQGERARQTLKEIENDSNTNI